MVKRYEHEDGCGGEYNCGFYECSTGDYVAYVDYENQSEALAWLLEEYHYMSRKMTEINNIVQPLWGEIRERRGDYQLIEDFIEQIKEKGLEQALKVENPK